MNGCAGPYQRGTGESCEVASFSHMQILEVLTVRKLGKELPAEFSLECSV